MLSTEKNPGSLQGPVKATVVSLHQDMVESFLTLELADGTKVSAVQESTPLSRLRLRQGSQVFMSFPARGVRISTD